MAPTKTLATDDDAQTPPAETAKAAEPAKAAESDLIQWTDEKGRKHTGSRHGSAYRDHVRSTKPKGK